MSAVSNRGWKRKSCGCVHADLPQTGKVTVRCKRHRGKPAKKGRLLAHFDDEGIVRRG